MKTHQMMVVNPFKILTLLLFTMVSLQIEINAQPGRHGRQHDGYSMARGLPDSIDVNQMIKKMTTELDLSAEQQAKVSNLSHTHFAAARKERKDQKMDRITKKEEREKNREAFESQINEILSDEQASKWEELRESRKGDHPARKRHRK